MNYCGHLKPNHSKFGNIHNPHFLKIGFQMFRFSKVQAIAMVPTTIQIPDLFVDFKWFWKNWRPFFQISDSIQHLDHVQTNLFSIIGNPDSARFQIPTVVQISPCPLLYRWIKQFNVSRFFSNSNGGQPAAVNKRRARRWRRMDSIIDLRICEWRQGKKKEYSNFKRPQRAMKALAQNFIIFTLA